ncbi:glycogen recognition site of AMP-activated protein kinase domain-containing protein [Sarocladium implicatum]|nr:glycogen recognition site of AMP-activated protein kinase domain-containing protein [Sarocladium implicatum]
MGSYTFKWEHPAEEVYVTGTFDNWTKSVQLEKKGDIFEKTVDLKDASTKIYYKFVVDNNWVINESSPKEPDHEGNVNNFLTPEQIAGPAAAVINTVTPESTTAKMAGEQPLEKNTEVETPSDVPGGFPITPANELDKPVGIAPLPAAEGGLNPVDLAPGEKIPETVTAQDINQHVKLDKESYEKSDALAGVDMALPPVSKNTIPEAGLPIADKPVTIQTVGAGATTTELAGAVPLEPKVPAVVKKSQDAADAAPEASVQAVEVEEKAQVESELKAKVPEAPSTSEGIPELGTVKSENDGPITGAVASAGATVAAAAIAAAGSVVTNATPAVTQAATAATDAANKNLPDSVKEQLPVSAQETLASHNKEEKREEVSPEVPAEVKQSIADAGKSPEAAANTEAVAEKKEVESELLKEVKTAPAVDDKETQKEAKKEEAASKADTKATEAESKLKTEAIKSDFAAATSKAKVEKAEVKDAAAETKKEKLEAKAEKAEAKAEAKVADTKAAAAGTAATKTEEKHAEKKEESVAANGSETKPSEVKADSTKQSEASTEQKKKNRLSSMFSKLKSKMK